MNVRPAVLQVEHSTGTLPAGSVLERQPKSPKRPRPEAFFVDFEDRVLYYDAFWHADGARVVLVGPPQFNLSRAFRRARFAALPSGNPLVPETRTSNPSSITALAAPRGTTAVRLEFGAERFDIPVRPNLGTAFADRRIITAMNRDNDLGWIAEWAGFHSRHHGAAAVALFDNGSTRYATGAIEAALAAVPGLKTVAVLAWPTSSGPSIRRP